MTTRRIFMVMAVIRFIVSMILRSQGRRNPSMIALSLAFSLMITSITMRFTKTGVYQAGPLLIGLGTAFIYRAAYLFGYSAAAGAAEFSAMVAVILGGACYIAAALILLRTPGLGEGES